jgi:hypothetical protein
MDTQTHSTICEGATLGDNMACKGCSSHNQSKFNTEMNIHFPGYEGLQKPTVWVFPEVVICLNCGFAEFSVPEAELHLLVKGNAA